MSSPLQKINELISFLPKGDIPFARRFVERRDWESLKELTWSSLQRLEKALEKETLPPKYEGIDVDKVRELALICYDYYTIIFPEENEVKEAYDDEEEL